MTKIDDGGPAFPTATKISSSTTTIEKVEGMKLRDYFAAEALLCMQGNGGDRHDIAKWCYLQADALIAEKRKTESVK